MPDRTLTRAALVAEARRRFGDDPLTWAFVCPHCGDIANAADFTAAGADPNRVGQECVGRHLGALDKAATGTDGRKHASRGCDWVAYGLFRGPWFIQIPDDKGGMREAPSFPLAPAPAPPGSKVWQRHIVGILTELVQGRTMEAASIELGLQLSQTKRFLGKALRASRVPNRAALVHVYCRDGRLPLTVPRATPPRKNLGPQESRVLGCIADGDTYAEIGQRLHLALDTVKGYVKRALDARGAVNAAQLVYLSHQDGLLGRQAPAMVDVHLPEPSGEATP